MRAWSRTYERSLPRGPPRRRKSRSWWHACRRWARRWSTCIGGSTTPPPNSKHCTVAPLPTYRRCPPSRCRSKRFGISSTTARTTSGNSTPRPRTCSPATGCGSADSTCSWHSCLPTNSASGSSSTTARRYLATASGCFTPSRRRCTWPGGCIQASELFSWLLRSHYSPRPTRSPASSPATTSSATTRAGWPASGWPTTSPAHCCCPTYFSWTPPRACATTSTSWRGGSRWDSKPSVTGCPPCNARVCAESRSSSSAPTAQETSQNASPPRHFTSLASAATARCGWCTMPLPGQASF